MRRYVRVRGKKKKTKWTPKLPLIIAIAEALNCASEGNISRGRRTRTEGGTSGNAPDRPGCEFTRFNPAAMYPYRIDRFYRRGKKREAKEISRANFVLHAYAFYFISINRSQFLRIARRSPQD